MEDPNGVAVTGTLPAAWRDVVRSARLWHIWTRLGVQDVRLRFRRSSVGMWWIFINLAVLILSIGLIYANLLGQNTRDFIPHLTMGLIAWGYLTSSIVEGGNAFVNAEGYIKQISLPNYVYVLRSFTSISLTTGMTFIVFLLVAMIYRVPIGMGALYVIPGVLLLAITSLLLITIFAHLNAWFRDIAHVAQVGMQVLFYVTPVIFPAHLLRGRRLGLVIDLNPMYHLLEIVRRPLVAGVPADPISYVAAVGIVVGLAAAAASVLVVFHRRIVFAL